MNEQLVKHHQIPVHQISMMVFLLEVVFSNEVQRSKGLVVLYISNILILNWILIHVFLRIVVLVLVVVVFSSIVLRKGFQFLKHIFHIAFLTQAVFCMFRQKLKIKFHHHHLIKTSINHHIVFIKMMDHFRAIITTFHEIRDVSSVKYWNHLIWSIVFSILMIVIMSIAFVYHFLIIRNFISLILNSLTTEEHRFMFRVLFFSFQDAVLLSIQILW